MCGTILAVVGFLCGLGLLIFIPFGVAANYSIPFRAYFTTKEEVATMRKLLAYIERQMPEKA